MTMTTPRWNRNDRFADDDDDDVYQYEEPVMNDYRPGCWLEGWSSTTTEQSSLQTVPLLPLSLYSNSNGTGGIFYFLFVCRAGLESHQPPSAAPQHVSIGNENQNMEWNCAQKDRARNLYKCPFLSYKSFHSWAPSHCLLADWWICHPQIKRSETECLGGLGCWLRPPRRRRESPATGLFIRKLCQFINE